MTIMPPHNGIDICVCIVCGHLQYAQASKSTSKRKLPTRFVCMKLLTSADLNVGAAVAARHETALAKLVSILLVADTRKVTVRACYWP